MTLAVQPRFTVHVRTGWIDFSPALRQHASERIKSALADYAPHVRLVTVQISGTDPRRPAFQRCDVHVTTDVGPISASATGLDRFDLIDRTAESVASTLRERLSGAASARAQKKIA